MILTDDTKRRLVEVCKDLPVGERVVYALQKGSISVGALVASMTYVRTDVCAVYPRGLSSTSSAAQVLHADPAIGLLDGDNRRIFHRDGVVPPGYVIEFVADLSGKTVQAISKLLIGI